MRTLVFLSSLMVSMALMTSSAVAQTAPTACTLEQNDVHWQQELSLLFALPPEGAPAEYPFVTAYQARRARIQIPQGALTRAALQVELETAAVRLRGISRADRLALYPARWVLFAGTVAPFATHALSLTEAGENRLRLRLGPTAGVLPREPNEWAPCNAVRLQPGPAFALNDLVSLRDARRIRPGRNAWSIYREPNASGGEAVSLIPSPSDEGWVLEQGPQRWHRVLWRTRDAVVLGWSTGPSALLLGHGSGTGRGARWQMGITARATVCPREVTLLAEDRGTLHTIGAVLAGAAMQVRGVSGTNTQVNVYDRDVHWADGVRYFVPTAELATCSAQTVRAP